MRIVLLSCTEFCFFVSFRLCTVVHVCVVSFSLCVLCRVARAAEVVVHCAFEVCRVLYLSGCAQLCMLVLYLFRCGCYVELRALQRWSEEICALCILGVQSFVFCIFSVVQSCACWCCRVVRAAEVVGSYFTESWFPAPETQILFSRPPPLCS